MSAAGRGAARRAPAPAPPLAGDHPGGRWRLLVPLAAAGALLLLYLTDLLAERWAGLLLAVGVAGAAAALAAGGLISGTRSPRGAGLAMALAAAVAVVAAAPTVMALFPGAPVAHATLSAPGASLPVAAAAQGRVRVLVQAHPGEGQTFACRGELAVGTETVPFELSRELEAVRVGKRGRGTALREHSSAYVHGVLDAGAGSIALARVGGACALELSVFPDYLPATREAGLAAALLAIVAVLAARGRTGAAPAVCAAIALAFGLFSLGAVTPAHAVRPAIGAVLEGVPVGGAAGASLAWICRKLLAAAGR
jgi:hypothetical protein